MLELEERGMSGWCTVTFLSFVLSVNAGVRVNLTGTWQLNPEKSVCVSCKKPLAVVLHIDHREPALTYSGVVTYAAEDSRPFSFAGAIDGKEYPMERSYGMGTAVLRRIDGVTFESVYRSKDGKTVETTRTSIAPNGKTLTRRIQAHSAGVKSSATEIYERR
jgi:hypothetical protein